jgi:hypothetical protein
MTDGLRSLEPINLRAELTAAYARVGSDLTDSLFMSSRDGVGFHRWDEAFLRPGPQAGINSSNWMYGDNYQGYGLFETAPNVEDAANEISMHFSEGYWREGETRVRRYTIRLDGFASVQAPYAGGELLTRPFVFTGDKLSVNFSTSAAGSVRVELQDVAGNLIQGYGLEECNEIVGESVHRVIRWKNGADLGVLAGRPVRLRFVMKDADIYSFQFTQ